MEETFYIQFFNSWSAAVTATARIQAHGSLYQTLVLEASTLKKLSKFPVASRVAALMLAVELLLRATAGVMRHDWSDASLKSTTEHLMSAHTHYWHVKQDLVRGGQGGT